LLLSEHTFLPIVDLSILNYKMKNVYSLLTLISATALVAAAPAPFVKPGPVVTEATQGVAIPSTNFGRREAFVEDFSKRAVEIRNAVLATRQNGGNGGGGQGNQGQGKGKGKGKGKGNGNGNGNNNQAQNQIAQQAQQAEAEAAGTYSHVHLSTVSIETDPFE
jgi:hypothetical protein